MVLQGLGVHHLPVSAYAFLACSSQDRPPASVQGVYCVKRDRTWQPGGASPGSSTEGMQSSIMGLGEQYNRAARGEPAPPYLFPQHHDCPVASPGHQGVPVRAPTCWKGAPGRPQ